MTEVPRDYPGSDVDFWGAGISKTVEERAKFEGQLNTELDLLQEFAAEGLDAAFELGAEVQRGMSHPNTFWQSDLATIAVEHTNQGKKGDNFDDLERQMSLSFIAVAISEMSALRRTIRGVEGLRSSIPIHKSNVVVAIEDLDELVDGATTELLTDKLEEISTEGSEAHN